MDESIKKWFYSEESRIEDLSNKMFYRLLYLIDFSLEGVLLDNNVRINYLRDISSKNVDNIEQEIFFVPYKEKESVEKDFEKIKAQVVHKLNRHIKDYFDSCE
jgi:predicted KAP-like P-loop ATPase